MYKAKHYDNSNNKNTFDTEDMINMVESYNTHLEELEKIEDYLHPNNYRGDKYIKIKTPFYIVIDSVALAISRMKRYNQEEGKDYSGLTPGLSVRLISDFEKYEKFFNETKENLGKLRMDSNKMVWKAAGKLYIDLKNRDFNKSLLKNDLEIKKLIELNDFSEKFRKAVSGLSKSNDLEKRILNLEEPDISWLSTHSDISFGILEISNLIQNLKDVVIALEKQKAEQLQLAKDKHLNIISAKNDKLIEENKLQTNTISKLKNDIANLQRQLETLSNQVKSPHKLAYKDAKDKLHNFGKKFVKSKPVVKER